MTAAAPQTVRVVLSGLPLALARRHDEHQADLLREFALLSLDHGEHAGVPVRLVALSEVLEERYADAAAEAERGREAAEGARRAERGPGRDRADVGRSAAARLLGLLEEADEYCRRGEHLLTPAPDPGRRGVPPLVPRGVRGPGPRCRPEALATGRRRLTPEDARLELARGCRRHAFQVSGEHGPAAVVPLVTCG